MSFKFFIFTLFLIQILHNDAAFILNPTKATPPHPIKKMMQREWSDCIYDKNDSNCRKTVSVPHAYGRFRCFNISAGGALYMTRHGKNSSNTVSRVPSPYYLLSTFAIWRTILWTTSLLFLVRYIGQTVTLASSKSTLVPSIAKGGVCHEHTHVLFQFFNDEIFLHKNNWLVAKVRDVALPLLSSACCAIQLFLNAVAGVGCAGFNTTLGPLRPYFISLLLYTTITTFSKDKVLHFVLSWFVAFMPELVHIVNLKYMSHGKVQLPVVMESDSQKLIVVELDIKDMGCVACINKINGSIRTSCSNVVEAKSWLNEDGVKGGRTRVVYQVEGATEEDVVQKATEETLRIIKDAGFQGQIKSVECT